MNDVRLWVLILALTSFAAGLGAGVLVGESRGEQDLALERSRDYRHMFLDTFELEPERERRFVELMARYDAEVEELRQRALEASLSQIEGQLSRLGLTYRDAIRNYVLPEGERGRFDALLARGASPSAPL